TNTCFGGATYPSAADKSSNKFTSKERDAETGLDFFEARYMSSAQGRFTSPDPGAWYLNNPQSYNGYSYALNNPLRYNDIDGESAVDRVNAAEKLTTLSIPYGQSNPQYPQGNCFDCSGLVRHVFGQDPDNTLGLPRTADAQAATFEKSGEYTTDINQGQAGDAVFFADASGKVVHTGIVVDVKNGTIRFVHAPRPGKYVQFSAIRMNGKFGSEHFVGFGRSIERTPVRQSTVPATMLGRFTQWWNSWSLFGPTPTQTPAKSNPETKQQGPHKNCLQDRDGNCVQ
ncbi:MAG: RHS repeat-associated core domain-containing protein, partial [Pirellulaceae bacterium]